ncbi:MAG: ROK family protein [Oligoflexia bacterium]|nr:ROK family protein [Oligoflexia bacterium]MBF0367420.1 ROK family protein [Oligoflexia bacterium]
MKQNLLYGGIEAGGTKFVCAVVDIKGSIHAKIHIPTTTPKETLSLVCDFFSSYYKDLRGIGIGSFGPLDLDPASSRFGAITSTPKAGWSYFNILEVVRLAFSRDLAVAIDTDVNAAALGEHTFGAAKGVDSFIYLTVGTGIGGGAMIEGKLLHGLTHPEMGHLYPAHDRVLDPFEGVCPYHQNCLEGLASGPAMIARWKLGENAAATELPSGHRGWELEAYYLASALLNYIMILSPKKIILGGGVMKHPPLLTMIRQQVQSLAKNYIVHPLLQHSIDDFIVPPMLGDHSGVLGASVLAHNKIF